MKLDLETKLKAIAEVFLGVGTLDVISDKYNISPSYLSTLASRARRAISKKCLAPSQDIIVQSRQEKVLSSLLKEKIVELKQVKRKIEEIEGEMQKHVG